MRSHHHLTYTPSPDIVHEAAGHAPIIANKDYAQYLINYGEVAVNKNMKLLITSFYNILLKCEKYKEKNEESKNFLFSHYLDSQYMKKNAINPLIIDYFNKYEAFCFELSPDSVLKGDFNFKYEKI